MSLDSDKLPLSGLRVVEVSSFVASPLCGLTLAQLGAEVIRVDPLGGAADHTRLPTTGNGTSIYWTGLNRGKQSVACDMRSPEGQRVIQRLITAPGDGGGILVTNAGGREWLGHDVLERIRADVITLEILGRRDGTPGVDYTVNAAVGFPFLTGPAGNPEPVNHTLPAWDIACGFYAAFALTAAVLHRTKTGAGTQITLPLENIALSLAGTLGYLTEIQVNGSERPRTGNHVYGTYGTDFVAADGSRFMIVALTPRHFRGLVAATGTTAAVEALESALGADFTQDADRFRYRDLLTALFADWFAQHTADRITSALRECGVLHERYRTFTETFASPDVQDNPLFAELDQAGVGNYLAAGTAALFDNRHLRCGAAPKLGQDTTHALTRVTGLPESEIAEMVESGILGRDARE
ncbi:CoA transferase [Nocardia vermiculata]|uniref:2-methylfumaryl-CoA isomerase n=1 Tax=Nocardia vermiculata TaxID=257274 RepID=A0A846Y1S1_9NOCA|nr:CoA transferase [Nocardia vermiculata]NKY51930.1 2-methylfumaryl-CoA isomerase [Nocardia vermiculata]